MVPPPMPEWGQLGLELVEAVTLSSLCLSLVSLSTTLSPLCLEEAGVVFALYS
jgi:hypothetical protein